MTSNIQVEDTIRWFSEIDLGGIPSIITNDSAFLSFVCCLTATEALSGYRYGDGDLKTRFTDFVKGYFPSPYKAYAEDLYEFRKKMIHAFSTGRFALTHHHSELHLQQRRGASVVLNAEDFYCALLSAAQKYFSEVRSSSDLAKILLDRLGSYGGGSITVVQM